MRQKRILAFLLTLTMILAMLPTNIVFAEIDSSAIFEKGNGTAESPYEIDTIQKLEQFRESVNRGNDYSEVYIKLTADIDMSGKYNDRGEVWEPIGTNKKRQFKGVFDGDGHKISEIYVNGDVNGDKNYQGLFGYVGEGGKIANLGVTGTVRGMGFYAGAVTGYNAGTIEKCYNSGTVEGKEGEIGGVVGHNEKGTVIGCYNTGIVINGGCVGGVVGLSEQGTIKSCYNSGNVLGSSYTGGVVGYFHCSNSGNGSMVECYNTGNVTGEADSYVGGLIGSNSATVERCYNTGNVTGADSYVGGLLGYNNAMVENCYNTGNVTGGGYYVGGVLGYSTSTFKNCYSIGAVSGIKGCLGGVLGYKSGTTQNPENCYYLEGTADGAVNGKDTTSTKKLTAEEMRAAGSFNTWEFDTVWEMGGELINRPLLKANKEKAGASEQTPYMIYNITDLEKFAKAVNDGDSFEGKAVKLMANIDLGGKYGASIGEEGNKQEVSWTPIGSSSKSFGGIFDGNDKKIEGLYINQTQNERGSGNGKGLFGYVDGGTVKKLSVYGTVKSVGNYIGGIVGKLTDGTIENCTNECEVAGRTSVGGVVGIALNDCTLKACTNNAKVDAKGQWNNGTYSGGSSIGGIVGYASSQTKVEDCRNFGDISAEQDTAGGIVGYATIDGEASAEISNCYSVGNVTAQNNVGGIVGYDNAENVTNCYYLNTTNKYNKKGTSKTAEQFTNGEVAKLLQDGQEDTTKQFWGQNLTNTAAEGEASNKDEYPVLTDSADKKVYKVSFVQKDAESESGYKEVTSAYANKDCAVAKFPTYKPEPVSKFIKWSQSESTDGEEFTASTIVSGDMTVYAVGEEFTVASDESDTVKLRKNKAIEEIDLKKFVKNKFGNNASNFSFKLSDGSALPNNLEFDESTGKISGTPNCDVGVYTVKFDVTNNNGITLMSVETSENGMETLTIKLDIGLEGEGTEGNPYIINNLTELEYFRDDVNSGNSYTDKYVKLADTLDSNVDYIDMSEKYNATTGKSWTPIGISTKSFSGIFDGNDKKIEGLYINQTQNERGSGNGKGLFGYVDGGTVKKLSVYGTVKSVGNYIGGIVGKLTDGTIENCTNECEVAGRTSVGGVVGIALNDCTLKACTNNAKVAAKGQWNNGTYSGGSSIGGIVGYASSQTKVEDCRNFGDISAEQDTAGGIVGYATIDGEASAEISNCYSVGNVTAQNNVGGIVGYDNAENVTNCYYLKTTNNYNQKGTSKTAEQFTNGEVAKLLQDGQEDTTKRFWGQNLTNTAAEGEASNKDEYPVLTDSADKKVYKVSFKVTDTSSADGYKDHAVKYVNKGKSFGDNLPSSDFGDYKIVRWVLDKADINSTEFTKDTTVDGDMSVYGVKSEVTVEANVSKAIECNKNDTITVDLKKYVANMSGNADLTKIAFNIDDDNSTLSQDWIRDDSTENELKITLTKTGTYTLKVDVANNNISLADETSTNNTEISSFTLTFNVDLEKKFENYKTTYLIYDLDDLEYFRDKVNGGKSYWKEYVRLADKLEGDANYIDMSAKYNETTSKSWEPIGKNSSSFEGTFDGNGKEIKGLYINTIDSHQGLFGYIENATIKNLTVNGSISGEKEYFGGIVGYADSSVIENCCNNANVATDSTAKNNIGGIAGYLKNSQISGCYNTGNISGAGPDIGGIVGAVEYNSKVNNCYNKGDVSTTYTETEACIGGIVGWLLDASSLKNSYNEGMVTAGKTATKVGGVVGLSGFAATITSAYYLDTCSGENTTFDTNTAGESKKEEAFASGEVAYLLQKNLTNQVWGQELNETDSTKNDKSPVLTDKANKKVYAIEFYENSNKTGLYDYTKYSDSYMNDGDTITLPDYTGTNSEYFYGWSRNGRTVEKTYTAKASDFNDAGTSRYNSLWNEVTFENIEGTKQTYLADTPREITFTPILNGSTEGISADDFEVKYYEVDENKKELKSITAVNAVSAGKYLYVIGFKEGSTVKAYIKNSYTVSGTDLPDMNSSSALEYGNIGYMYITSGVETAQKPISFKDGTVNLKVGGTYTNTLNNANGTTATYESSNTAVATVDANGEVTAKGKGTATITATSVRENSTPVYASYTVNVGLATKTLTAENVVVTAQNKVYDETKEVKLSATLKNGVAYEGDNIKLDITGEFENSDAGENKTVNYKIIGISGTGAENYVLENDKIESTTTANITKASVTIICSAKTTRTFDGNAQEVDVSAMANGKVFDKSNYTVKYNGGEAPSAVGVYTITIKLTEDAERNYTVVPPTASLEIKSATQEVFSIELKGVSDAVYYGDSFTLSADGATGDVEYASSDGDILAINGTDAVANSTGTVTITATSKKDGYVNRVATKTIEVKKRVLTPSATATDKTYDGENGVTVTIDLENVVNSDSITAAATGTMVNADAGKGKIVYVNGITLSDNTNYTLSTQSLQTTVDIDPITITGFEISADDKKYDKSKSATASVTNISDVLTADMGQVEIIGKAEFDSKDSSDNKTVTFTATGLSGAKAQNYVLDKNAKTATDEAKIEPLKVDFVIGQTTFVYDKKDKEITASANDENGKIFKDFVIEYTDEEDNSITPKEVGTYKAKITLDDTINYYTEQGDIDVTVSEATQDSLVIVGLPGTIQYGDSFEIEAVGGEDDGEYQWTSDNSNVTISDTASSTPTITINGAVGEKVEISVTKTATNYEPISAKVVFVPTAKMVTFEISNLEQTYGNVSEVNVTPSDENATYDDVTYNGSADLPTNAGTYTVKVTANGNYTGTQTATLTIKKATATGAITGVDNSYTYGATIDKDDITATSTMSGVTPKITFAGTGIYVPQEEAPTKVGNYTVIAEFTDSNYETLTVTKDFVIEKAELTVKAKNVERAYGDANPIFELEYSGFANGEDENNLLAEPVATVKANASSPVTDDNTHYYITVSGGSAENYKFKYDNTGELVIKPTTDGTLYITGSSNTVRVNDVFTLHAFFGNNKVNAIWGLKEGSPTDVIELDEETGKVTAKKSGTVTITAKADKNYVDIPAEFTLTVKQTGITLVPTGLVKTYTGDRQDISFANNADFTPILSGEGKNVDITYSLISDPTVTEPIQVGTYSVVYTINDGSYTGGGNATMYINKATVSAKVKNDSKTYGDEYKAFDIEITNNGGITNETVLAEITNSIKAATTFASDGSSKTAVVKEGGYEIIPTLSRTETDNVKFTVNKGTLTVNKAPLTIKVKDVIREYGAENPTLEAEYTGFVNDETKDVLGGELILAYDESINAETAVGTYEEKTTANGVTADNYEITFKNGDVEVTKIAIKSSSGTSRANYLTVDFDKAVEEVTFKVTDANGDVEITEVTASKDNKSYKLNGSFTVGTAYTVEITYDNATQDITNKTLTITPTKSSGGGGGGGGGASSTPTSYTVTFDTNGGSKVDSVKVTKNNTVTEPTEPTKDGFVFDGWYTDKKLTTEYDFDTKVTKAITLYAKWTEKKVDDNKDDNKDDGNKPSTNEWKNPFTDVTNADWFFDNVRYANENGLMSGTTNTEFAPNMTLTRGMLVTILYRLAGEPAVNKSIPFVDVTADSYYANAVIWAEQNGIISGINEIEFAPDENITREQIAVILYRYAKFKGYYVSVGEDTNILSYTDFEEISEYAIEAMQYAVGSGLINGKTENTLNPKDNATRAEIAVILNRFVEGNK